ncbi:MAG: nucleotidyltransferase family protein [Acidobacteriota bacterium]|nr:nucleotidyltransferase family protein [Acidobacteriota bacterium]
MNAEREILLCCAVTHPGPERVRRLPELLGATLDWNAIFEQGGWHGTLPLLYWNLQSLPGGLVPPEVLIRLRSHFHETASRNLFMTAELVQLLSLFRERGIAAVPLKGPALAHAIYDNLALREFSDLDILVPRRDVGRVQELLASRHYRPQVHLSGAGQSAFIESNYELCFAREGSADLEIHWGFQEEKFLGANLSPDGWWDRLEPSSLGGQQVLGPPRQDLLIFLCAHGAKHVWNRLKWISDIAELLRVSPEIDWRQLMENAEASGAKRLLLLGIYLAQHLLGSEVPAEIIGSLKAEPALDLLAERAIESLWNGHLGILKNGLFHLNLRTRWRDKASYCLRNAMVPTAGEWELVRLPEHLSFLYYPIRPVRLLATHGWAPIKRFFG